MLKHGINNDPQDRVNARYDNLGNFNIKIPRWFSLIRAIPGKWLVVSVSVEDRG